MSDIMELVEILRTGHRRAMLAHHSTVSVSTADVSDAVSALERIERLVAERDRCHARLEIDHYFKIGDNNDGDPERVEVPMEERASFPDGISAREATIDLLQTDLAENASTIERLEARCERLVEALKADVTNAEIDDAVRCVQLGLGVVPWPVNVGAALRRFADRRAREALMETKP